MRIDVHTHIWPDRIAPGEALGALEKLAENVLG